jgi:asparagine synthase (glutamine-hydrolysing)
LRALRDRGADALAQIEGPFAIAAWNATTQRGLFAIDRVGVHRLVYGRIPCGLAFATTLDLLAAFPGVERKLSRQALFDYVFQHVTPGPQTVFVGLDSVPAGHCVEFSGAGAGPARPYWSLRFDEADQRGFDDLKAQFLGLLQSGVAEAAEGANVGAFLSGGTDSSTVSGMLARVGGRPARTFSIGFDAAGYDEMEYARIAAKHYGCAHHEYYVTPKDVVDSVQLIAATYDQPFGNASAVPTYYCAKFAREHGIDRLLAGDGGDELFGGNERYAKHHLLGLYQRVPPALRRLLVEPMLAAPTWPDQVPLLRKLRSYVLQARPAMPGRYASASQLTHLGVDKVFSADFLAGIDENHPGRLLEEAHAPHAGASLINQMLGIDMRFILADGDLPKVTRMCELAGVDVAFPLLDDRLVEFSRHLPSDLKLRGSTLRWFFKKALSDFLPPAVITKQKHGFGLPVGTWLVGHKPLFDLAGDSISSLRHRGIVQPRFIDELLDTRLREHPAYFGGMAWVLMMLGVWLDSRKL